MRCIDSGIRNGFKQNLAQSILANGSHQPGPSAAGLNKAAKVSRTSPRVDGKSAGFGQVLYEVHSQGVNQQFADSQQTTPAAG
jgi:hypothetical protein